jgi:cyclopropane-fatty-acyl-phospholipid synthase
MPAAFASARTLLLDHWQRTIRDAAITVTDSLGTVRAGVAKEVNQGEEIALHVKDLSVYSRALSLGSLGLGEAYMDGHFEVTAGGLDGLWTVLVRNRAKQKSRTNPKFMLTYGSILLGNWLKPHAANIHTHYDEIGQDVFEAFLGPSLTYTCGYATSPDDDLETMQYAKLDRICRKLELKAGERLVDLGCGWGSLLLHATKHYGVQGYGITNSAAHAAIVRSRAQAAGVADRVHVQEGDFSTMTGTYDKLATVGMYEHLRPAAYPVLFDKIATLIKKGGLALLHAPCTNFAVNRHDPFIQKYIFPGSNWPTLIQTTTETARAGLAVLDVENLGRHYALTVRHWSANFEANRHRLDPKRYDDRFIRMMQFYFGWGVGTATASDGGLYQWILTNDHARPNRLVRI